jgi:methylase of polypeptide subunit release factors
MGGAPDEPSFIDRFSDRASLYRQARPTYPEWLFETLASLAPGRDLAWDCGAGSGQAAVSLAHHFARVHASEPSRQQLAEAEQARVSLTVANGRKMWRCPTRASISPWLRRRCTGSI